MPSERPGNEHVTNRHINAGDNTVVTKLSPWSMADTVARLSAVVAAHGLEMYAVIDHSAKARSIGLDLRATKVVMFGSPSVVTTLIEAAPLAALDLPLHVVV